MNGRERVEAAMIGTGPDRVPVMCQLSMGHIIKNSGIPPAEFYLNYNDVYADNLARLTKKYNFDGVLMDYPGFDTDSFKTQLHKIVNKSDGQSIIWKNGDEIFCPFNDYPIAMPKNPPVIKPLVETSIDDLPLPGGYRMRLDEMPDYFMEPFRSTLKLIGGTHSVHAFVGAPLSVLMVTYGMQDSLMGLIDYPDICKALLEQITETCILWVDNMIDTGIHAICVTAPFEGSGVISLGMYEEFGHPYTFRLVEHIRKRGIPSYIHMCGKINDRLEAVVSSGIDGLECLDPHPIGDVYLDDAVKRIGDKVFIKGNMDPVNTILMKEPNEIYDDAVNRIKIASGTKRFILSSACSVSPNTPEENLKIIVKAAEDYGRYV